MILMTVQTNPKPRFKVGQEVYLGGFTRCKVLKCECYRGQWQYDLKAATTELNRTYINVKEQYILSHPRRVIEPVNVVRAGKG